MICFGADDDFEFCSGPPSGSDPEKGQRSSIQTPDDVYGYGEILQDDPADECPLDCLRPMPTHLWRSEPWREWMRFLRRRSELQQAS